MKVRLSGLIPNSLVNGLGMRRVLFAQGCKHYCKGCFNPETWDFKGGEEKDCDEIINDIINDPIIRGVTFSGGDPFYQADKFAYISKRVKTERPKLNIWCYTGFTFEECLQDEDKIKILNYIDILVDGKFIQDLADVNYKWAGSTNQRVIDVQKSLQQNKVVLYQI